MIAWIWSNIPVAGAIIALILGTLITIGRRARVGEAYLSWYFFLGLGIPMMWDFMMHGFYPQIAAENIGWQTSPFQWEVAVAALGMGIAGVISFFDFPGFRAATAVMFTCFLWGAAAGHIYQFVLTGNVSPGNVGPIFWWDVMSPLFLFIFFSIKASEQRAERHAKKREDAQVEEATAEDTEQA